MQRRLEEKRALASDAAHAERLKALLAKVRQKHENSEPTKVSDCHSLVLDVHIKFPQLIL